MKFLMIIIKKFLDTIKLEETTPKCLPWQRGMRRHHLHEDHAVNPAQRSKNIFVSMKCAACRVSFKNRRIAVKYR